ncbi:hypothetical protein [Longimycelium tulufanense]|uniref:hypothetical protein n=1 Tax=Longimycelium tulufanense TaxID=907463 RepID=UPI00166CD61D|nr:hypothetical protein [Longimycelium tulufanense]
MTHRLPILTTAAVAGLLVALTGCQPRTGTEAAPDRAGWVVAGTPGEQVGARHWRSGAESGDSVLCVRAGAPVDRHGLHDPADQRRVVASYGALFTAGQPCPPGREDTRLSPELEREARGALRDPRPPVWQRVCQGGPHDGSEIAYYDAAPTDMAAMERLCPTG